MKKSLGENIAKFLGKALAKSGFELSGSRLETVGDDKHLCFTVQGVAKAVPKKKKARKK